MNQFEHDSRLRRHGLPTLVPVRRWGHDLVRRTAPLTVFVSGFTVGGAVLGDALAASPDGWWELYELLWFAGVLTALVAAPGVLAWATDRWLRSQQPPRSTRAAVIVTVVALVVQAITPGPAGLEVGRFEGVTSAVGGYLMSLLVVWSGVGALVWWAVQLTLQNLKASTNLASTALPVIFGLVIFTFFSTWMWQLTDHLPWARIGVLAVVIAVIATVVLLPSARGVFDDPDGHPLQLTRLQRLNVMVVVVVSQLVLASIFALLLAALLIVLGKVALSPAALEVWLRHPPTPLHIGSATLPISGNLLKGALFLSTIASLTFIISIAGDTANRKEFFEPAVAELRRLLAERDEAA